MLNAFLILRAWSGSQGPESGRHESKMTCYSPPPLLNILPSRPLFSSLVCAGGSLDTGKQVSPCRILQLSCLFSCKSCPPHFKHSRSGCTLIKLLCCPTNMTSSKFVELLDNSLVYPSHDIRVDTSGPGHASSDSSAGTGSPDSHSPPDERVYRDRFPSPTRQSMESPTESPTRRRLRKLSLKKDA